MKWKFPVPPRAEFTGTISRLALVPTTASWAGKLHFVIDHFSLELTSSSPSGETAHINIILRTI